MLFTYGLIKTERKKREKYEKIKKEFEEIKEDIRHSAQEAIKNIQKQKMWENTPPKIRRYFHDNTLNSSNNTLTYKGAIFKIAQLERKEELELEGALEKYKKTIQKIKETTKEEIDKIENEPLK